MKNVKLYTLSSTRHNHMDSDQNPQNAPMSVESLLQKQQYYMINSVLNDKVLDVDKEHGGVLIVSDKKKHKETQQFTLIKRQKGYLIHCKSGGYLTIDNKNTKYPTLYLNPHILQDSSLQLFKISTKMCSKGSRIDTLDNRAIGIRRKQLSNKTVREEIVLCDENSQQNQLWNFCYAQV